MTKKYESSNDYRYVSVFTTTTHAAQICGKNAEGHVSAKTIMI